MSVSPDFGQREIWALGSISAQLSQMSTSGKRSKCVCSPVIEEGVWLQVWCAGGFLIWLTYLMVLRVHYVGGPLCPGHPGCVRVLGHLFPRALGQQIGAVGHEAIS